MVRKQEPPLPGARGRVRLDTPHTRHHVATAFRLRHQEGEDLAIEALRRWLKRPGAAPARLLEVARHFPEAEPMLLQALRFLA